MIQDVLNFWRRLKELPKKQHLLLMNSMILIEIKNLIIKIYVCYNYSIELICAAHVF
jgi:hypothetical protein